MVQGAAIRRPAGVSSAFTNQLHQECNHAGDVYPWRSGLPDAAGRGRRTNVSRAKIPQDSHRNASIPQLIARTFSLRSAVAPHRAATAYFGLVRSLANGYDQARIRGRPGTKVTKLE